MRGKVGWGPNWRGLSGAAAEDNDSALPLAAAALMTRRRGAVVHYGARAAFPRGPGEVGGRNELAPAAAAAAAPN